MRFLIHALLLGTAVNFSVHAAVFTSARSGFWTNPCTWASPGGCPGSPPTAVAGVNIPGPNDEVRIAQNHAVTLTANANIRSLTLLEASGSNFTSLTVNNGVRLNINGNISLERRTTLNLQGGTVYATGSITAANNGNVTLSGTSGSRFFAAGCSNPANANFIDRSTRFDWCVACGNPNNPGAEGGPGDCAALQALPVELLRFQAESRPGGRVHLRWHTAWERNNAHFDLERSADGQTFSFLVRIAGQGTTSAGQAYEAWDNDPPPSVAYYRLVQVDRDGHSETSGIVAVRTGSDRTPLQLHPNPTDGSTVEISLSAAPQDFRVTDLLGRRLPIVALPSEEPGRYTIRFLQPPPSGVYVISAQANDQWTTQRLSVR
ncbi:MAG: T9SS type A sorting domain-containing protein [Cytophagales bacterium]|jgi:hypothetical protein|nr:T9SS type A sorting domain-containing protein [Cytophagales bacterium]